jgi:hypothetical protein
MVKNFKNALVDDILSVYVDDVTVHPDQDAFDEVVGEIRPEVMSMAKNLNRTLSSATVARLTFSGEKAFIGATDE